MSMNGQSTEFSPSGNGGSRHSFGESVRKKNIGSPEVEKFLSHNEPSGNHNILPGSTMGLSESGSDVHGVNENFMDDDASVDRSMDRSMDGIFTQDDMDEYQRQRLSDIAEAGGDPSFIHIRESVFSQRVKAFAFCGVALLLIGTAAIAGAVLGANNRSGSSTTSLETANVGPSQVTPMSPPVGPPAGSPGINPNPGDDVIGNSGSHSGQQGSSPSDTGNEALVDGTETPLSENETPTSVTTPPISEAGISNPECLGASRVSAEGTINGSTKGVTTTAQAPVCGDVGATGLGVWYKLVGDNQVWTASTCEGTISNFDTQISILTGSCGSLSCVAANDQYLAPYQPCGDSSTVSWYAETGQDYFILVHGYREAVGDFQLSLQSVDMTGNSACDQSEDIGQLVTSLGSGRMYQTFGSTRSLVGRTASFSCSSSSNSDGRWYTFKGEYTSYLISTCSDRTNYDAKISVFTGDSCGNLQCATNLVESSCSKSGSIVRLSGNPQTYYVLVHGTTDSLFGEYELTFKPDIFNIDDKDSTICYGFGRGSPSINVGVGIPGLGGFAPTATSPPVGSKTCTSSSNQGYQADIMGTGSKISLSTCNDVTNYDAPISVFAGDTCDSLECVEVFYDECNGSGTAIYFNSIFQTRYLVVVHDDDSAGFQNSLMKTGVATVDRMLSFCDFSKSVTLGGAASMGILAEQDPGEAHEVGSRGTCDDSSYDTSRPHAWYHVVGSGQMLTAHTCDSATNFDSEITVFSGSCGQLTCVAGNDQFCGDQSAVSWQSEAGQTYYILVHGHGFRTGVYGLRVVEGEEL